MNGPLETTRANFSFSDRRRSNQPRKPLPRQQSFLLEPLESRLLLSVTPTFVGTPTLIDGPDVNITQRGGVQAEEAIAINPTNPANIIAAPNDGPGINGTPSRDSVWVSQDAGANWTRVTIPIPAAGTMSHGDPTIVFDGTGRAVYAHLVDTTADHKGPHFVATAASTDGGLNWTASNVDGPNGVNDDKQSLAVGPGRLNPGQERFYIAWDRHDLGNVIFTSSSVDGINWSAPVQVDPGTDRIDTHMAVGGDGTVYLFFQDAGTADHSDIMFSRSVDDGANWSAPVNIHTTNINPFDSTFSGGGYTIPAQPDRGTWPSLSVDIDRSGGPFDGRLYVSFTDSPGDSPAADHNNTNVFVMTSDDGGANWSTPVMVNDDSGTNSQFMSWLAVDQTTGFVGVSWHDARNDTGSGAGDTDGVPNTDTQMWGTVSVDGGAHFLPNIQISAGTSNGGDAGTFNYGDYTGLTFFGSSLFPAWADNSNSTGDNPDGALSRMDTYTSRATLQWTGGEIVNMFGDSDFLNEDDTFKIVLDASGTFIENGTLKFTATESVVTQINAFGFGGNDTLIVDSSNGLINVANGIRYNGGNGFDKLSLLQTGGTTQTSDTYSVGAIPGAGADIIVGPSGTQTVFFEDLAPVLDLVPAQSLTVNATPANNAISYLVGPTNTNNGLVTIDDQEPIEFSKKVTLTINAEEGSDTISLSNPNTPTSLSEIFINGGDPSGVDTLSVTSRGDVTYIPTDFDGGILELTSSPVKINGIEVLSYDGEESNGRLTIVGTSGWLSEGPAPGIHGGETVSPNNQVNGAIQAIAVDPTNANIMYVGSVNGGIWKTTNATAESPHWVPLTDNLPSLSIGALELDPTDATHQTLIAGIGSRSSYFLNDQFTGVLRSTDGGATWSQLGTSAASLGGENITSVAARGTILLAGADNVWGGGLGKGLFRSTDSGANWTLISDGAHGLPNLTSVTDIVGDPLNSNVLYAAVRGTSGGVFKSTNTGLTWTNITSGIGIINSTTDQIRLAVHHDATNLDVFATVDNNATLSGVFRSVNGGNFLALDVPSGGIQGFVHGAIAADPTNPNLAYVGLGGGSGHYLTRIDASKPSGSQITDISGGSFGSPHVDTRDMQIDANGNLILGTDGGLFRLPTPTGNTGVWSAIVGDISVFELHSIAYDHVSHVIMAGAQDNGTLFQQAAGGTTWDTPGFGDGGDVVVDDVSQAASGRSIRYFSSQFLFGGTRQVYDSTNNLVSTTRLDFIDTNLFTTPVELNNVNPTRLLIGGSGHIFMSGNQGTNFISIADIGVNDIDGNGGGVMVYGGFQGGVGNADLIYAASGSNIVKQTAAGGEFTFTSPVGASTIRGVTDNPTNWASVFAIDRDQVFESTNAGETWVDVTANLTSISAADFRSIEYVHGKFDDALVVGTSSGAFTAKLSGLGGAASWRRAGGNLPDVIVYDLDYDAADNVLVAGTMGRGAWLLNNATTNLGLEGGDDTIVYTPGGNDQAGSIQVDSLLMLNYQNLGSGASLTVDGAGGTDTLVYNGTAANDTFSIDGVGATVVPGLVQLNSRLPLTTANVEILTLQGFDGDDLFRLVPAISASVYSTININGGGQASATGDRVELFGTAGPDNVTISGQVVSLGGKTINGTGIEDIHLDASGGNDLITYNAVTGVTENITVSSSGEVGGGQISVPGVTLVDFVGVGHIAVNGNTPTPTETDTLTFAGTNANDTFNINLAATGSATDPVLTLNNDGPTLLTLDNYTNFNTLNVLGLGGADTFNVTTSADGPSRNLFVDGGLPSGENKSTDVLKIFYTPPRPKIILNVATQDPDAGIVDLQYDTARFVVQYDDVERPVLFIAAPRSRTR